MVKEEITKLRSQKDHIQMMVYNCIRLKQDATRLIIEYHKIVDKLVKEGCKVYIRAPYLKLEYWGLTQQDILNSYSNSKIIEKPKETHHYILNLAWTGNTQKNIIDNIRKYFDSMDVNELSFDQNEIGTEMEYIIKYEFEGTDESFQILKKSACVILDILSTKDFNIAIYGKKRNY